MEIAPDTVVNLRFTMTDDEGNILDQSIDGSFYYVHGAGKLMPVLEQALAGKAAGDTVELTVPPIAAFGERDENLTEIAPLRLFKGALLKPGMTFQARDQQGRVMPLKIVRIEGEDVHVDANHPLAGLTLYFTLDVIAVRAATQDELRAGRPVIPGAN